MITSRIKSMKFQTDSLSALGSKGSVDFLSTLPGNGAEMDGNGRKWT